MHRPGIVQVMRSASIRLLAQRLDVGTLASITDHRKTAVIVIHACTNHPQLQAVKAAFGISMNPTCTPLES